MSRSTQQIWSRACTTQKCRPSRLAMHGVGQWRVCLSQCASLSNLKTAMGASLHFFYSSPRKRPGNCGFHPFVAELQTSPLVSIFCALCFINQPCKLLGLSVREKIGLLGRYEHGVTLVVHRLMINLPPMAFEPGSEHRHFVIPPPGTSWAELTLHCGTHDTPKNFWVHTTQLLPHTRFIQVLFHHFVYFICLRTVLMQGRFAQQPW